MSPAVGPFVLASRLETLAKLGNKRSFFCSSGLRLRDTAAVRPILVIFGDLGILEFRITFAKVIFSFFFFLFVNEVSAKIRHGKIDRHLKN